MNSPLSAKSDRWFVFDAFRIDMADQRLWVGDRSIPLRPKSWDVLRYLVERPGLLVTKEALHHTIWQHTAVSEDTLTQSICELRKALGDDARRPRFIETVHRRGFRFIATVSPAGSPSQVPGHRETQAETAEPESRTSVFVGRQRELRTIQECIRRAHRGTRQIVFVTGEAGIGKTTVVEEFLRSPAVHDGEVSVLRGQCVQQYGPREPYMPIFEALERFLTSLPGAALVPLLARVAPTWYAQMPSLRLDGVPPESQRTGLRVSVERMLREFGTFVESMATQSTVVLVLEDLHWSDIATVDLLSFLTQRRDPARLLIISTYRPAEASVQEHPIREVKQSLQVHHRCTDLALGFLSPADVAQYLRGRFGEQPDLVPGLHRLTDGNPLFLVGMVEELIRRGWLSESSGRWMVNAPADRIDLAVPTDLREMITLQLQHFDANQRTVLEAASVAGMCFAPQTVAAAVGRAVEDVEATCRQVFQPHGFLNFVGRSDWPEGRTARPYEFVHALHRQVIYEQIPDAQRRRLHRAVGEALESVLGEHAADVAAELSIHFERSGDQQRAVAYLGLCAVRAQQRGAQREAVAYIGHALGLLEETPESLERRQRELDLRLLLNISLNVTCGYASTEVSDNCERAQALCEAVGDVRQLFEVVHASWYVQGCRNRADSAWRTVAELERIAERLNTDGFRRRAELARGRTDFFFGNFGAAVRILGQVLERATREPVEGLITMYGVDPIVAACTHSGVALWFLGFPDQARTRMRDALSRARQTGVPYDLASAFFFSALLELFCGNPAGAGAWATRAADICTDKGIAFLAPVSRFVCGAVLAEQGDVGRGLVEMQQALAEQQAVTGSFFCGTILAFIAAAHGRAGQWEEGLRRADEGLQLTETALERIYAAELWRIKGELHIGERRELQPRRRRLGNTGDALARQCFGRAVEIAREQGAQSLVLRSVMNLVRLSTGTNEDLDAYTLLHSIYATFTEGFDTEDLREAKGLLEEIRSDRESPAPSAQVCPQPRNQRRKPYDAQDEVQSLGVLDSHAHEWPE